MAWKIHVNDEPVRQPLVTEFLDWVCLVWYIASWPLPEDGCVSGA